MAAIYYHPEAYSMNTSRLMGRNAAGDSFLKGFLQYKSSDETYVHVTDESHKSVFTETFKNFKQAAQAKFFSPDTIQSATEAGCIYLPGPNIGEAIRITGVYFLI